jgi:hypothetical protein
MAFSAVALLFPLRITQAVFAVIVLGLSGYVANWYNTETLTASPKEINFLIYVPVWTLLVCAYLELAPRYAKKFSHPYIHLALEVITSIKYFAGFIALSVFLAKLLFCRGSVCAAARASAVFGAFSFAVWTASSVLLGLEIFKGGFRAAQANNAKMSAMSETSPA